MSKNPPQTLEQAIKTFGDVVYKVNKATIDATLSTSNEDVVSYLGKNLYKLYKILNPVVGEEDRKRKGEFIVFLQQMKSTIAGHYIHVTDNSDGFSSGRFCDLKIAEYFITNNIDEVLVEIDEEGDQINVREIKEEDIDPLAGNYYLRIQYHVEDELKKEVIDFIGKIRGIH